MLPKLKLAILAFAAGGGLTLLALINHFYGLN